MVLSDRSLLMEEFHVGGIIPYASSLDHVGDFTTAIEDAAKALEVLAGRDDRDMTSSYQEVEAYASQINADIKGKDCHFRNVQQGSYKS